MKTFVIGDIHGTYKALQQCLERSGFNFKEDKLICLGDVADGYSQVIECIDLLDSIPNLVYIIGNHDQWLINFFKYGQTPSLWLDQGGKATLNAYINAYESGNKRAWIKHFEFFEKKGHYKYIDEKNRLFVHGGYPRIIPIEDVSPEMLMWDRDLWAQAMSYKENNGDRFNIPFEEVYIGHTTTENWDVFEPMIRGNVINMDTGAGYNGKLSIMNIDSKEVFQSDWVRELYPNEQGRG
jgi:serine/threonine protein phosphatase 1